MARKLTTEAAREMRTARDADPVGHGIGSRKKRARDLPNADSENCYGRF